MLLGFGSTYQEKKKLANGRSVESKLKKALARIEELEETIDMVRSGKVYPKGTHWHVGDVSQDYNFKTLEKAVKAARGAGMKKFVWIARNMGDNDVINVYPNKPTAHRDSYEGKVCKVQWDGYRWGVSTYTHDWVKLFGEENTPEKGKCIKRRLFDPSVAGSKEVE